MRRLLMLVVMSLAVALTFHELSHASHYSVTGRSNYAKLILYELSYALSDGYGPGGTGSEGEGLCELSETYAYSFENYIRKNSLGLAEYDKGTGPSFFFADYTKVLTAIMTENVLTPGQVFSCITQDTGNMDTLLNNLCATYPSKATTINELMSTYGL